MYFRAFLIIFAPISLLLTMASFSIEDDGYFISNMQPITEDPFAYVNKVLPTKSTIWVEEYLDISDNDFVMSCLQKRLLPRSV